MNKRIIVVKAWGLYYKDWEILRGSPIDTVSMPKLCPKPLAIYTKYKDAKLLKGIASKVIRCKIIIEVKDEQKI